MPDVPSDHRSREHGPEAVNAAEYGRVARSIREGFDVLPTDNTEGRRALRDVAETVAKIYAGTTRIPANGRAQFLAHCGITNETGV